MLTDLVHVIPPDGEEEPEDIFAFAAGLIFTDDSRCGCSHAMTTMEMEADWHIMVE